MFHRLKSIVFYFGTSVVLINAIITTAWGQEIPLPEHPRPDFQRAEWVNLNGVWHFEFDEEDKGEKEGWYNAQHDFSLSITVPFSWGAPLSGVENSADIGWYKRDISVPENWSGERVFIVVGASDWLTKVWIDGNYLGEYRGGYTPFEFELTDHIRPGEDHQLVIRVDDREHEFKLFGKQGYGPAKGIWQTPYLEARGAVHFKSIQFNPNIDENTVQVHVQLDQPLPEKSRLQTRLLLDSGDTLVLENTFRQKKDQKDFEIEMQDPRLWTLDDPFLYDVQVALVSDSAVVDQVNTYFGMREIGIVNLPGTDIPYVALNKQPVYLQLALDQAYHPEGYYTFPSDDFVRDEIVRSKQIGLNGQRVHVKVAIPRKLYWADRLGMLIMADVPNSWGEPDAKMQLETETALRGMIARDYNHPSVFSWVIFNETWGLMTKSDSGHFYTAETKDWVSRMVRLAKELDPTRLVEDNSANRMDHVLTDINTWHAYLPGYEWATFLETVSDSTFEGSAWNFASGYQQGRQPMFNSECGNVWGYQGSTGDVDWSWDYHIMMNQFRRHPKVAGWLYTEHHDVINEWNGYYKYDRSEKYTGMEGLVEDISLKDLHSPIFLSPGLDLCTEAAPGAMIAVPLWLSVMTDSYDGVEMELESELYGWDILGNKVSYSSGSRNITIAAWSSGDINPLVIRMPDTETLAILRFSIKTADGAMIHQNFTTFTVEKDKESKTGGTEYLNDNLAILRVAANAYQDSEWSVKQWEVLDGLKVNGAGTGFFEYHFDIPEEISGSDVEASSVLFELSSKPLLGKDVEGDKNISGDYMRGKGFHDPGRNSNAYPMTDDIKNPSGVEIMINGVRVAWEYLPDDPADHRGILSWHAQPHDKKLREAGTYGRLIRIPVPGPALIRAFAEGKMKVRLAVSNSSPGGLAVYGKHFGAYPVDPTVVLKLKNTEAE